MLPQITLIFVVFASYQIYESNGFLYEEYYWQDFEGIVPPYALAGGIDVRGNPVYIGQVLYASKLLPAKIYEKDEKAYFAWGYELSSTKDVKILCTKNPERFKWIQVKKNEIHKLINHRLVKGGWETSYDLYIGRAFVKQQTLVGRIRVYGAPASNLGLYISAEGKEVILDNFEILTYVPEANSTEIRHCDRVVILSH